MTFAELFHALAEAGWTVADIAEGYGRDEAQVSFLVQMIANR